MSLDLSQVSAAIFVFAQPDCPACHVHVPVLVERARARAREGFLVCEGTCPLTRGQIPILIYDVTSTDHALQDLLKRYNVTSTPTTVVVGRTPGVCKLEGSLTREHIDEVLSMARGFVR